MRPPPFRTNRGLFATPSLERVPARDGPTDASGSDVPGVDESGATSANGSTTPRDVGATAAYRSISDVWAREVPAAREFSRAALACSLVRPILEALGHDLRRASPSDGPGRDAVTADGAGPSHGGTALRRRPDYVVPERPTGDGPDSTSRTDATASRDRDGGDGPAAAVVDVHRWGRPFGTVDEGGGERAAEVPAVRMHAILSTSPASWGVLTDGRRWRLYHDETSHRLDTYYEVDLESVLETDDPAAFREFHALFRGEAVLAAGRNEPLLDALVRERRERADRTAVTLRENVARAIEVVARSLPGEGGDLEARFDRALVAVFRLLVCRFAAARPAVSTDEPGRGAGDLLELGRRLAADLDDREGEDSRAGGADRGSPSRRIDGSVGSRLADLYDDLARGRYGAAYDGWLFPTRGPADDSVSSSASAGTPDAPDHVAGSGPTAIGDDALATAVLLVTHERDGEGRLRPLDYEPLDVRHLGRIYEEVLGYDLAVAADPLALEDGGVVPDDGDRVSEGEVYLTADGDRKATGSFYTPEAVVADVVEHAVGPLCSGDADGPSGARAAPGSADAVLDLCVLDPAMGSGHFLSRTLDVLSRELLVSQERDAARDGAGALADRLDVGRARGRVAANCLYGVDLDPIAVALARASLWLRTLPVDGAASGLRGHLTAGNALVGTGLEWPAVDGPAASDRAAAGGESGSRDDNASRSGTARRERLAAVANVHTAGAFGLEAIPDGARAVLDAAATDDEVWDRLHGLDWVRAAERRAAADRYLHWGLAFPEVAPDGAAGNRRSTAPPGAPPGADGDRATAGSDAGTERSPAGFDAVVGNPPWVATAGRAEISARMDGDLRSYLAGAYETTANQFDLYVAFLERSLDLARDGRLGVVVPDSILAREGAAPIRRLLCEETELSRIVRLGVAFEGVETGAVTIVTGTEGGAVRCIDASDDGGIADGARTDVPQSVFESRPGTRFLTALDGTARSIVARLEDVPPLERYATVARGEELGKNAAVLSHEPGPERIPIAPGAAIVPYGIDAEALRYVDPTAVEKDDRQYRSPKLAFRQTGDALVGTYDDAGLATIKSAYTIRTDSADEARLLKHLLGVLCSPLLSYYHHHVDGAYRSVFPQLNQSTLEGLPVAVDGGPDEALVAAVEDRLAATADRAALDADPLAYLDEPDENGPTLGSLESCRSVTGVDGTLLAATAEANPSLRIGSVRADRRADGVVLSARLRYKPDAGAGVDRGPAATDRWGYVRTEPLGALRVVDPGDDLATLLEAFVPRVVEEGEGFAGFRARATATVSPLDRLRTLALPRPDDVASDLAAFRTARDRARDLRARRVAADRTIHDRVCSLFGLSASQRGTVRREFGDFDDPDR